jgi:hypothetical protein
MMQTFPARFLVTRDDVVRNNVLMQVTTGPQGEILALAVDRNWSIPDLAEPPYTYAITSWDHGKTHTLRLDGVTLRFSHVQTLGPEALLLVAPRARGMWDPLNAIIVDWDGAVRRRFTLSDGIEDTQVDPAGRLWVSYFDEGIFSGLDLSREGLVCFSRDLEPTLRFNTLAQRGGLPQMYDCYALNVASHHDAYTYYYGESVDTYWPLVHLCDGNIAQMWQITAVQGAHALAIDDTRVLFGGAYQHPERLTLVDLATGAWEEAIAADDDGQPIKVLVDASRPLASPPIWGRGRLLYVLDARGIWELAIPGQ